MGAKLNHLKGIFGEMIYLQETVDIAHVLDKGQEIPFLNSTVNLQRTFPKLHVKTSH